MDANANPREEQLKRIAENAAKAAGKEPAEAAAAAAVEPIERPGGEINLNDEITQEQILDPEGVEIKLSYGTIRLYPPSMRVRKLASGFCRGILADGLGYKPSDGKIFQLRVAQVLLSSAANQIQLCRLIAQLCGKPGQIDEKTEIELATELLERTNEDDTATLFAHLGMVLGIGAANPKK